MGLLRRDFLKTGSPSGLRRLAGRTIAAVGRRGKCVVLEIPPRRLVLQLGMAGRVYVDRPSRPRPPHTHLIVALAGGVWLALSVLLYPWLIGLALPASLGVRVVVALLLMTAPGFLMGIPFPSGLRLVGEVDPADAPAYWGLNAEIGRASCRERV